MRSTVLFLAVLGFSGCAASSPGILQSGTYQYTSTEGRITLKSSVAVSREAGAIVLRENAQFSTGAPIVVETRLDPSTYSTVAFSVKNDPSEDSPLLKITPSDVTYVGSGGKTVVANAPVPGAPSWVFSEWASAFAAIPAMVHATGAKTLNAFYPTPFRIHGKTLAQTMTLAPVSASRPDTVPPGDAALGLSWHSAQKPAIALWYDPSTFVVDAVVMGGAPAYTRER